MGFKKREMERKWNWEKGGQKEKKKMIKKARKHRKAEHNTARSVITPPVLLRQEAGKASLGYTVNSCFKNRTDKCLRPPLQPGRDC